MLDNRHERTIPARAISKTIAVNILTGNPSAVKGRPREQSHWMAMSSKRNNFAGLVVNFMKKTDHSVN